ncbi:MAG: beta-propeller fold lactonase family protein [Acidobacteriota bacterium]
MSKRRLVTILAAAVFLLLLAGAGYPAAYRHVAYYTGAEPATMNCSSCHVRGRGGIWDHLVPSRYHSPQNLAVSPDGRRLYATARDSDALLVIDLEQRRLVDVIPVGRRPFGVALDPAGKRAYVTNEWSHSVSVVDLERGRTSASLATGEGPAGVLVGPGGKTLFVANRQSGDVSVIDLNQGKEVRRLAGGGGPNQMALSLSGNLLVLSNELSFVGRPLLPPVSELTVIETSPGRVVARHRLVNAHLLEGVAVTPNGDLALVALVQPKNLLPAIQVARGWMMTEGLGVVKLPNGPSFQLLLDEVDRFYADPFGLAVTPDGRYAFVSHAGVDRVSVVDLAGLGRVLEQVWAGTSSIYGGDLSLSRRYVVGRIQTAANPKGIVVSPQGDRVYVAERLNDSILTLDVATLEPVDRIRLSSERESVLRRGERLFNSAAATFQGQFSCRSCHPHNHVDRLQYDFEPDGLGRNIVDNRSLLGIGNTAPFKWNGENTSLFMQCGIRFARILTRLQPFPPDDLSALVAFLRSLPVPPRADRASNEGLTPAQQRGKVLFERRAGKDGQLIQARDRCVTCHPAPNFTDRTKHDVGSSLLSDSDQDFDTPQLRNVDRSAPYLHDGRAGTLEEIWTLYNRRDQHGITSDMNKRDLNDLIQYLKTL